MPWHGPCARGKPVKLRWVCVDRPRSALRTKLVSITDQNVGVKHEAPQPQRSRPVETDVCRERRVEGIVLAKRRLHAPQSA